MSKMSFYATPFFRAGLLGLAIAMPVACRNTSTGLPETREQLLAGAILIKGGEYEIGSHEPGCHPVQKVQLADFYIWPTEVTLAWWNAYTGSAPAGREQRALPAAELTYDDAEAFCAWLSAASGARVRLPSAAEWLVAAQAGTPGMPYPWGWGGPAGRAAYNRMAAEPVASYPPNAWNLYDMAGNVAEWCTNEDPIFKPVMGGSWAEREPGYVRSHNDMKLPRMYRGKDTGFRIAIEP